MTVINIRLATPDDDSEIARIQRDSKVFAYWGFLSAEILEKSNAMRHDMWQNNLKNVNNDTFVAEDPKEDRKKVAGFIGINPSQDKDLTDTYELTGIYLDPQNIGIGLGRELMDYAKQEIKARGYNRMSLWVFEKKELVRQLYEKAGLSPDGAVKEVYGEKVLRYVCALN